MPVSLTAIRALGVGLRIISRRRLVERQPRSDSGLLPLVPVAHGLLIRLSIFLPSPFQPDLVALLPRLFPDGFKLGILFLILLDQPLEYHGVPLLAKLRRRDAAPPVSLAAVHAVGVAVREIDRRRFVEGDAGPESGFPPLVPALPRPLPFLPADFDADLQAVLLILLGDQLEHHFDCSFRRVDQLFGQIDYAAGYRQAAQDYGQDGPAVAFGYGRGYRQAQGGDGAGNDQDDAKGQGIDDYFDG